MAPHNKYLAAHVNPSGAGDARPTAMDIIRDSHMQGKLTGKVVLLTGGGSGIGIETARAMAATGATLFITARDVVKARAALENVLEEDQYTLIAMEQSSLQSVRDAGATFLQKSGNRCNILICNAGVMACPYSTTAEGFETQFGVNHLSHFLLFQLLKDALLASSTEGFQSRVVMVASSGHRRGGIDFEDIMFERGREYHPFLAYGQSKTGNIYMANEIERRYGGRGLHGLSLHPGGIRTGLQKHMDQEMVKGWDVDPEVQKWSKSVAQGASTTVFAATSREWEGRGGVYLEDCDESVPFGGEDKRSGIGYKPHIYDVEAAKRLWDVSLRMVELNVDD